MDSKQSSKSNEIITSSTSSTSSSESIGEIAFKGVADLIKLLPSGTVFMFQFLSPLLTNTGHCSLFNKIASGVLLAVCTFSCCFSSFTDSYVGRDGKVYYGMVTKSGLYPFSDPDGGANSDLSKYKLRLGDFVHAFLALVVFAVIALLDTNTVACFYPALEREEKTMVMVLPTAVGGLASFVFMVFPNNRHGIGYLPSQATVDLEAK